MDIEQKVQEFAQRAMGQIGHLQTEESTKTALIMPFIQVLGFDVFNPTEVVPEFTADVGTKKGEKVDYAIMQDGNPIMLFECKVASADLSKAHASQLYRYFSVTSARVGVLTNGIEYRFFSDLDDANKMDEKPFLLLRLDDLKPHAIGELKRFTKGAFDVDGITSAAIDMKYMSEVKRIMSSLLSQPDDDFITFFTRKVSGRLTSTNKKRFEEIVPLALKQFINERVNDRLMKAQSLGDTNEMRVVSESPGVEEEAPVNDAGQRQIVTTEDEIEGFYIVRSILREDIDVKRVHLRDTKSYCGILLDDNNRKPICRLRFNTVQKYLGVFGDDREEERIAIESVDDIYQHADKLRAIVKVYDAE